MIKTIYIKQIALSIVYLTVVILLSSCSMEQPDVKMQENSLNKIEKIEKLKNFLLSDYTRLIDSCKQHTDCSEYHGNKCYLPANSHLLHKYLSNQQELAHLDYLTDNNIITENISIRNDSTIRFEVKAKQFIRGDFDAYNDTAYYHEIVYNISGKEVYELGDFITIKSKQIKPNWVYLITKQWID